MFPRYRCLKSLRKKTKSFKPNHFKSDGKPNYGIDKDFKKIQQEIKNRINSNKSEHEEMEKCSSAESDDLEDVSKSKISFEQYVFPDDYWKFKKAVKYLDYGRPLLTALALIIANDCDFQNPLMLQALNDHRILEILLNFLSYKEKRIQAISLQFIKKLANIRVLRLKIVYLNGIESLVALLKEAPIDLRQDATACIVNIAKFHKAWEAVRISNGIPLLVNMIYLPSRVLEGRPEEMSKQLNDLLQTAENAAEALFLVCKCRKNQIEFLKSGALRGCQNILRTSHTRLCTLVLKIIIRCAKQKIVRLAISKLRLLDDCRDHFYSDDQHLMQAAARAAYLCADGEHAKDFFAKEGFVDKLYEILQTSSFQTDNELMASISCALWKCAEHESNLNRIQALNAGPLLVQLIDSQPKIVQEYLAACLACCLTNAQIRATIRKNNGIETLVRLLRTTHPPLIMHVNKALAAAAVDSDCILIMEKEEALRLMWSHLKNENPSVVCNTAWQLASLLKNYEKSASQIRSLVGGAQTLIECLRTKHTRIATAICALIVVLSKDRENLRILTNYQVVDRLSQLTSTKCRRLRYHLCMAITACCKFKNNREEFAKRQVVQPLIRILKSKTPIVAGAATHALYQIAHLPMWCAIIYNTPGVYEILMKQMNSPDRDVQESAAGIIQKMRLFPLNREGSVPDWLIEKHSEYFRRKSH